MTTTESPRIFDAALVVKALRDAGYKDTYHALAELIDNSIQAEATQVRVFLFSKDVQLQQRASERISAIAVLDNGAGMTKEVLTKAIKFGDGTRLNGEKGLGKFGMGLPASSISQCQELSVWSWQEGVDNAMYTNLSLDAIKKGDVFVPEPIKKALSKNVSKLASSYFQRTGTLVMWENLDRLTPKRFDALSTNLEFVIGRMYRKQIFASQVEILVHDVHEDTERRQIKIRANDPLYLMAPTATPQPFDSQPMFVEYNDFPQPERIMSFNGKTGKVKVKVSHIPGGFRKKYQAENRIPAGASDFGKHAAKNLGISICREGRELKLDAGFADPSDPRDRFWGLEIDFEQELDELFAVPTNKQDALAVAKFHSWNWKDEALPEETQSSFLDRIKEEMPGREQLIKLFDDIDTCLKSIRSALKIDGASPRSEVDGRGDNAEAIATKVAENRENAGNVGEAFKSELPPPDALEELGEEEGIPAEAMDHLKDVVLRQNRFGIEIGHNPEAQSFFQVRLSRGLLIVVINSAHRFYSEMWEPMFVTDSTSTAISDDEKIRRAEIAFKLTLLAWARLEDETKSSAGEQMRHIRSDWGRILREFLQDLNDSVGSQTIVS